MQPFTAGTLAGAGSFRCDSCGFAIALHERDEVPECPSCGNRSFRRASLFDSAPPAPAPSSPPEAPGWLAETREALVEPGYYLAFEADDRVQVVGLQEGWTRIGRSLSAHVRFDDPTVSRRHALLYCDDSQARILDDRSLNGVFRNGHRVDLEGLRDGDEIAVGRFRLYFIRLVAEGDRAPQGAGSALA